MRTIGNILWFIFGGLLGGLAWVFAGCIWCITIIGIPVGLQCFKFATLAFWPFGKEIVYGNGMFSFLVNLIWIVFFGWEMALGNLIVGCTGSLFHHHSQHPKAVHRHYHLRHSMF